MATWRPVGKLTPIVGEWRFLAEEATGTLFRINCAPLPQGTPSYLWIREWRNNEPGPKKLIYPKQQQTFVLGEPGPRLIEISKAYPLWARKLEEEPYEVGIEERIEDPAPAPVEEPPTRPWVGYH